MKILELHISGFGKFKDKHIVLGENINILYGENEAGKSTIHSFIRAMLYGLEKGRGRASKYSIWAKYEPWENTVYQGIMKVSFNSHIYRIERNFSKGNKDVVSILEEDTGIIISPAKPFLDKLLCGLSEATYYNTVSIGQLKSETDENMVSELKNYIANMNTTGNMALNINKAVAYLKDQRKSILSQTVPEAAKAYASNISEIKRLENEISNPMYINNINSLKENKSLFQQREKDLIREKETLIGDISKKKQFLLDYGFTEKSDIDAIKDSLSSNYKDYNKYLAKSKSFTKVFAFIFVILSVLSLSCAIYMFIKGTNNIINQYVGIPYDILFAILMQSALVFIIASSILIKINLHNKKKLGSCAANLTSILSAFSGNNSEIIIDNSNIEELDIKLNYFYEAYDDILNKETALINISDEINNAGINLEKYSSDIELQQKSQWELENKIEHLSNLKDENSALKNIIDANKKLQTQIQAIDLALETMTNLSSSIKNSFGLYLNKEASNMVSGITDGIYNSMSIDENLNIFMNTKKKLVPLSQVSSGTMDQIYLALRLASAKLMQGNKDELPIIFDDSFVNYDKYRLSSCLKWLSETYNGQIIMFTCHSREAQLLKAQQIDFNFIKL